MYNTLVVEELYNFYAHKLRIRSHFNQIETSLLSRKIRVNTYHHLKKFNSIEGTIEVSSSSSLHNYDKYNSYKDGQT